MTLKNLFRIYSSLGCGVVFSKKLAPNDNSKNQVYLGGSFSVLNIIPFEEILPDESETGIRTRFKAKVNFSWVSDDGKLLPAPDTQLILYPKYPEVRLSGFLTKVDAGPSELMNSRTPGRRLFLGISSSNKIYAFVAKEEAEVSLEFKQFEDPSPKKVFTQVAIRNSEIQTNAKEQLIEQLGRIHELGWITSTRLNKQHEKVPCNAGNCGGYTLEAELGIAPNGYSEPDYLGWEIKQFTTTNFNKWASCALTLMTPEPTAGDYVEKGIEYFIRTYGYPDKKGRDARINFGGIHKTDTYHPTTGLKLHVEGFDLASTKIVNADGFIGLLDKDDYPAAKWSFTSLLKHWNTKHAQACYVPSLKRDGFQHQENPQREYSYSNLVMLGEGTDFSLFLNQLALGTIYYDPGIKLEEAIPGQRVQKIKRRSQFRINTRALSTLYKSHNIIDVSGE